MSGLAVPVENTRFCELWDRRELRRVRCSYPAYWKEDRGLRKGEITDLSTSGAYVETATPARRGAFIQLGFVDDLVSIEIAGMVVHQTQGIKGMGVCFRSLAPDQRMAIEKIIQSDIDR
jgi:hypothetical protein